MIDYEEALSIVLAAAPGPDGAVDDVPLHRCVGRVLAREVLSDVDMPPFTKSGMDGFAVRTRDLVSLPATLKVAFDVPAGSVPERGLGPGEAASVMTGAPVPDGADAVVQVEWTSGFGGAEVTVNRAVAAGANVSPRAEIAARGDRVLPAGRAIGPEEVALLAAVGRDPVPVHRPPRVAVLITGDELVAPSAVPGPGCIRDTNGPTLTAFLGTLGLEPASVGRVRDDREAMREAIAAGLEHDFLLVTGGVSAGSYDFVEDVLASLGVTTLLRRVAIKPGKPTVFGQRGGHMVFGLPGNPVSALVIARVLVEPALRKRIGLPASPPRKLRARLAEPIRKKPDRLWFVHGVLSHGETPEVVPLASHGAADLPAASRGDCLILAPRGIDALPAGGMVDVIVWGGRP
jgi:molybdopterin molybdotransferase